MGGALCDFQLTYDSVVQPTIRAAFMPCLPHRATLLCNSLLFGKENQAESVVA